MLANTLIASRPLKRFRRLAIAAVAVVCSTGGAAAQGPMGPPPPAEMFKTMCNEIDALFAARMAFIQARVTPTPDQMAEWEAFVASARATLGEIKATCSSDFVPPDRKNPMAMLAFRERRARHRAELFRAERVAVERFMKVLSPQQQQNLGEAVLRPPVGSGPGPAPGLPPL